MRVEHSEHSTSNEGEQVVSKSKNTLAAVGIGVADLDRATDFYTQVLGMTKLQTFHLDHVDEVIVGFEGRVPVALMKFKRPDTPCCANLPIKLVLSVEDPTAVAERDPRGRIGGYARAGPVAGVQRHGRGPCEGPRRLRHRTPAGLTQEALGTGVSADQQFFQPCAIGFGQRCGPVSPVRTTTVSATPIRYWPCQSDWPMTKKERPSNYPPLLWARSQVLTTARMVWNLLAPLSCCLPRRGLRRAVSMTVRMSASPLAAHIAR